MNIRTFCTAVLLAIAFVPIGTAQAQRIERMPGYFDFREIEEMVGAETTLEVNVKGALLRMAAEAARVEDETLAEMLLKLVAIQVRGYTLDYEARQALQDRVGPLARRLESGGWDRVVRVHDNDEFVEMLVRDTSGEKVEGMMVMVISRGQNETVFVNIVGEIDPEDIGRIGRRFRIDVLEDL